MAIRFDDPNDPQAKVRKERAEGARGDRNAIAMKALEMLAAGFAPRLAAAEDAQRAAIGPDAPPAPEPTDSILETVAGRFKNAAASALPAAKTLLTEPLAAASRFGKAYDKSLANQRGGSHAIAAERPEASNLGTHLGVLGAMAAGAPQTFAQSLAVGGLGAGLRSEADSALGVAGDAAKGAAMAGAGYGLGRAAQLLGQRSVSAPSGELPMTPARQQQIDDVLAQADELIAGLKASPRGAATAAGGPRSLGRDARPGQGFSNTMPSPGGPAGREPRTATEAEILKRADDLERELMGEATGGARPAVESDAFVGPSPKPTPIKFKGKDAGPAAAAGSKAFGELLQALLRGG